MLNNKQIQMNLKFLGYYSGNIDGIIGSGSKGAIEEFQKAYGLVVDGIYGTKSNAKMLEVIKQIQKELGVIPDGIAGPITTEARNKQELNWNNIKYFKQHEFACKCGCGLNSIDLKLVKILDEIRSYFNRPIQISSGCRCAKHNKNVGGVANSKHVTCKAVDVILVGGNKTELLSKTKEYVAKGQARYTYTNNTNMRNAVHIDIN